MKLSHPQVSNKSYVIAVCLSGMFGVAGIQHFYLERWIEAILDLSLFIATLYLFFTGQWLWALLAGAVDALHTLIVTILLLTGSFNDGHGKARVLSRTKTQGWRLEMNELNQAGAIETATHATVSEKGFVPTALLCYFLGFLGVHRFYAGKIGTGILMILTFGGFGIWVLVDMVLVITGSFRDKQGLLIKASN